MILLGDCLASGQKYADAEPLLRQGYEGMKQARPRSPDTKDRLTEAVERLVQLYEATGKPAEAAEWQAKLKATAPTGK